ncbi:MAG: FAD-dependent oxidoreductase [Pseudomonadota bacterium]
MTAISRRSVVATGLGAALAGCADTSISVARPASTSSASATSALGEGALKPLDLSVGNLTRMTVCTRPFRPAGPRLETETIAGKTVIHNYGHGGSGWSLAWGYADEVRIRLAAFQPKSVSVLGAGAMGLTTAIALAETGAKVTIIARDLPMESRSAYATGVWSPSSRIGLKSAVEEAFPALWASLARKSYARHLQYVGRAGHPVEFTPRFYLRTKAPEPMLSPEPESGNDFLHLDRMIRDLTPPWAEIETHPFPNEAGVRSGMVMTFNIAEYTRQLTDDFLAMGGRIERGEIASLEDLAQLPGDVAVNCSGFDAKVLAGDSTLIPVRGQISWMPAQTDRLYGIIHRNVTALSRRDGVIIQETGGTDYYGLGDDSVAASREEFLSAQAKVAPMFDWQ